jgi:hypothetical protein
MGVCDERVLLVCEDRIENVITQPCAADELMNLRDDDVVWVVTRHSDLQNDRECSFIRWRA